MTSLRAEFQAAAREVLDNADLAPASGVLWPQIVELGWLLIAISEQAGGLALPSDVALGVHLELGRKLAGPDYLAAMLAIEAVLAARPEDCALLGRLAEGARVAAPLAGASLVYSNNALSGRVSALASADVADLVLLWADEVVVLLPGESVRVRLAPRPTWDETRRLFDLPLDALTLEDSWVLARGTEARWLVERIETYRDLALAADGIGASEGILQVSIDYLKERRQFGRPLALFQALKHRCADMRVSITAAEALLGEAFAVYADGADPGRAAHLARMAKGQAAATGQHVAEEGIQLHGGIAMTKEHVAHLFLKRALLNAQLGRQHGSYDAWIGRALLDPALDRERI